MPHAIAKPASPPPAERRDPWSQCVTESGTAIPEPDIQLGVMARLHPGASVTRTPCLALLPVCVDWVSGQKYHVQTQMLTLCPPHLRLGSELCDLGQVT